jgi:hypothetical protein
VLLRRLDFSSQLQRMSVLVQERPVLNGSSNGPARCMLFCKGAPEAVIRYCDPASGERCRWASFPDVLSALSVVPAGLMAAVESHTRRGFHVLVYAHKPLPPDPDAFMSAPRSSLECDLRLVGLLALENALQPETEQVVAQLNAAQMQLAIITGDNPLTAVAVGRALSPDDIPSLESTLLYLLLLLSLTCGFLARTATLIDPNAPVLMSELVIGTLSASCSTLTRCRQTRLTRGANSWSFATSITLRSLPFRSLSLKAYCCLRRRFLLWRWPR